MASEQEKPSSKHGIRKGNPCEKSTSWGSFYEVGGWDAQRGSQLAAGSQSGGWICLLWPEIRRWDEETAFLADEKSSVPNASVYPQASRPLMPTVPPLAPRTPNRSERSTMETRVPCAVHVTSNFYQASATFFGCLQTKMHFDGTQDTLVAPRSIGGDCPVEPCGPCGPFRGHFLQAAWYFNRLGL